MKFIILLFAHYVLDFPLQGEFLASNKGKNWYCLLAHCIIYTFGIYITMYTLSIDIHWYYLIILFLTHAFIDYIKANAKNKSYALTRYLWIDQLLHITINLLLMKWGSIL